MESQRLDRCLWRTAGRRDRAVAIALELAPNDPLEFNSLVGLGAAHFIAGRYADTALAMERALVEHPSAVWAHRLLCPAYAFLGRKPEAKRSLAAMRLAYPDLTIGQVTAALPLPEEFRSRVADGLDSIGLAP